MISFNVSAFAEAAKAIRNVPSGSRDFEILDHALIDADTSSIKLTMSDMDVEASVIVDCKADAPVSTAIPRSILEFFILRAGKGDETGTLEFDEDLRNVTARHGKARLTQAILPADMFPHLYGREASWSIKLLAHELCDVLSRTERAVSTDLNRTMLHGPFLHQFDGQLRVIAADGYHIHIVDMDDPEMTGDLPTRDGMSLPGVIIPPKTVKEVLRIFGGDESGITVSGNQNTITIEADRIRIISKLIDATFFDYPGMLPELSDLVIRVSAEAMQRAIDGLLVAPKTDGKGKREAIRTIKMTVREGAIELFGRGDNGDAEDLVDADTGTTPAGTEVAFAAHYLRDAIDAARSKEIAIHMPPEIGRFFHVVGSEGATFLIGPRRI